MLKIFERIKFLKKNSSIKVIILKKQRTENVMKRISLDYSKVKPSFLDIIGITSAKMEIKMLNKNFKL